MLKNYPIPIGFKIAFRNLWKSKAFSLINILGLALGMACSLLIMLWVNDEYSVDAFHKNGAQLFSLYERQNHDGQISAAHQSPGAMADEMKRVLPEVQYATNYGWNDLSTFEANNKINKENGNYAGQDFFKMFSYPILEGKAATALQSPLDIAVSKKMVNDFFGSPANAIGKTIRYQTRKDLKITTVFHNIPANNSAQFDYIINWQTFLENNAVIAFTTEQRQKEISIRKILGAGLREIVPLMTTNFIALVGISCLIAFPVAYLFMDKWVKIFPYNTGLTFAPFLLSAFVVLLITLLTVLFHTVRAAVANPANSLRTE